MRFMQVTPITTKLEEVRQCVQGGKLESAIMPLADSIAVMEIVDRLLAQ